MMPERLDKAEMITPEKLNEIAENWRIFGDPDEIPIDCLIDTVRELQSGPLYKSLERTALEVVRLEGENDQLKAKIAEMRTLLKPLERVRDKRGDLFCFSCGYYESSEKHGPGCAWKRAMEK